ncbi:rhodanese-like domain-containing protein [Hyphobacterium sp. WM6]|uniref:rhodanese-like domain-containing protein n=1 Tax=Hyphobacterium sp. WM6 TaxID=3140243 RepID=UPI0031B72BDE
MSIHETDAATLAKRHQAGEVVIVDVREPHEFAAERIHGALLHPLSTFDPKALPAGGDRPVILHCGSGKRSADALSRCAAANVSVDTHLKGGIMAWKQAGLPTIAVDPSTGRIIDPQRR